MNDKQRVEFEKWATTHHGMYNIGSVDGVYPNQSVAHDWFLWQAAISSVVVNIPSFFSDRYETDIIYSDDMEKALDRAGIRYE